MFEDKNDILNLVSAEDVKSVDARQIDAVINHMIQESSQNYNQIGQMALDCSAALSSAQARANAMAARGLFRRSWDKLTGKDDKLRQAITNDSTASQYAMQQMVKGVLKECAQNQKLLMIVKSKFDSEFHRLEESQLSIGADVVNIRKALVTVYKNYLQKFAEIEAEQDRLRRHTGARCEYCKEELSQDQVVCPYCGTLQALKLEKFPMEKQENLEELSRLVNAAPDEWGLDIAWSSIAKEYAYSIKKAQQISRNAGVLHPNSNLYQDIENLINKCRSAEFHIAVVGVLKAGKSTLLNALLGMELAPVGLNSTTAALTKFRSSKGNNYVKVRFYSKTEWKKLNQSATKSPKTPAVEGETSLEKRLYAESVVNASQKWIGHSDIVETFQDINSFREGIKRWTAADSDEHLFAAEVEVGINKKLFSMPEEVVFVDTPGLHDPVKYRSAITEKYISSANAVLVAVKPDALGEEAYKTVTTVLDYAGTNKKKVYIIGTQLDKLAKKDDYEQLICGEDGWIQRLTESGHYKNQRAASAQIFTVSAKLHLCLAKALRLSDEEFDDEDKFSNDEYNDLDRGVKTVLGVRRYALENLRSDAQTVAVVTDYFGVEKLKNALKTGLISQYRKLKLDDIASDYAVCKAALMSHMAAKVTDCREKIDVAQKGTSALYDSIANAEKEKKDLEAKKSQIESALAILREFTAKQIDSMKL